MLLVLSSLKLIRFAVNIFGFKFKELNLSETIKIDSLKP
jgi:hypothetical protein